jgi:hypothetical protein
MFKIEKNNIICVDFNLELLFFHTLMVTDTTSLMRQFSTKYRVLAEW